ncbi:MULTISPECIES: DUF4249 domain-containing protein [unclassified Tenacibaculum]|uniref:DUF4249 domain-containing protein n=1 Tax=unclassified Tenacibaculum TaxID=2635139 RepID=UPI001F2A5032|nr:MULTISPECIES: DUF4249 domain-containing protein [unclassified Tenacibaculum]MCF2875203.1 DUF4249 domain-containing protein [Tenacibaculum sp. Cn5-1]MCF2935279.1 DUF4249 domain-containing protein [Tenacibaculum sp. Cn5-34]MCG7511279.1 DUF4249 domain-containing protein [Tenacibaculum sp. Cn5-46]
MKKIYKQISMFLVLICFHISCTEVINVSVPNAGPRLVVEASINWTKGTTGGDQTIILRTSTAYFDTNKDVPVTGAQVKVINTNSNAEFVFSDQGNGRYTTNSFIPVVNDTYKLEIIYNSKTYEATETLMSVVDIKKVEQTTDKGDSTTDKEVTIYFDDPENEENHYLGEFLTATEPVPVLDPISDSFTNGNQNFMEYENKDFVVGSTLNISLYGISKQYYNYINLLVQQSSSGGPFTSTPAQLKGNCKNITDSNEEVLGYFRLGEVAKVNYVIQ